jgi:SPP1 gp7 family putative phage head morphogenesis protein
MSRTEDLLDKAVLLGLLVDQYSEQYYDESLALYNLMVRRVSRILRSEYGRDISVSERRRIIRELDEEVDSYRDSLRELARDQLTESSNVVYDRQQELVVEVDPDLNLNDKPDVTRGLFSKYHAIEDGRIVQLDAMYTAHIRLLREQLQDVVTRLSTIVEDEPVAEGHFISVVDRNQNNLNAVSLTSVALAASLAKQAFYSRNKKLFRGYQWVSVLDSRTTAYCQERHMKVWYYDDPENSTLPAEEHPPGHFRCRSQTTPIFKGDEPLDSPTFEEWFERQDEATKRQVLGARRYELYRSGDLDITDVNNARGERRTLQQLRDNE